MAPTSGFHVQTHEEFVHCFIVFKVHLLGQNSPFVYLNVMRSNSKALASVYWDFVVLGL